MENHLGVCISIPASISKEKIKFKSSVQALEEIEVDACVCDKGQYAKYIRTVVYTFYGLESDGYSVLLASYTWANDAARWGENTKEDG
ncbi:hypothetical protein BC936DRAFT_142418 [Jimgerdemannia flammicorona]|uniref:Uncharacterized protein n=1 Tax=Jimgerdemannia flammicorona TaxID=994334 RepID=A0A433DF95_9FUNG|nr:hypothetical protein BC936DRAFT_142418 [Jimgerdemannia flammicorona]